MPKLLFTAPVDFDHWVKKDFDALIPTMYRHVVHKKELPRLDDCVAWVCNPKAKFVIDEECLALYPKLRILITPSTGTNHIGVNGRVRVFSLLDNRRDLERISASAEYSFMLIMEMLRRPPKNELQGKTVGLVGFGRIGKKVDRWCKAFDARTQFHDPFVKGSISLARLFKSSDAVLICCSLNDGTRNMITGELIDSMKEGAVLVNTARGEIVNEAEMTEVLKRRKDLRVALDVVSGEVNGSANYKGLLSLSESRERPYHQNLVITPHIAGETVESRTKAARIAYNILKRELKHAVPA